MLKTPKIPFLVLLLAAWAGAARAQSPPPPPPPSPAESVIAGLFRPEDLSVEVNLGGALLHLVGSATREDDPDFATLVSKLQSIRVRISQPKAAEVPALRAKIQSAVRRLDAAGWEPMIKVRESGQESYIYLRETGGKISGLVVLFMDEDDEAGAIEITGEIDPAKLGELASGLHLPRIPAVGPGTPPKGPSPKGTPPAEKPPGDAP